MVLLPILSITFSHYRNIKNNNIWKCTNISWADAQPGDLVFYPDNSHVGIIGGRDANGELLVIHCASGYNNVVITGASGFTSIGRPVCYTE